MVLSLPPISTLIRNLRPFLYAAGLSAYICCRVQNPVGKSLLEYLLEIWTCFHGELVREVKQIPFVAFLVDTVSTCSLDIVALTGLAGLVRVLYCLCHFRVSEWKDPAIQTLFDWARQNLPFFTSELSRHTDTIVRQAEKMLKKDPNRTIRMVLSDEGLSTKDILCELRSSASKENATWETGKVSGTVYSKSSDHTELMSQIYRLFLWANPLHPGVWPRVGQCESEIIAMTAQLLHGPSIGCLTSGGTDSIFTALRAHLKCYGKSRGIMHPEVVCGTTAHVALNKACEVLGIRLVAVDCNDGESYALQADRVRRCLTSNTIMIFASAPSFPQGVIDPIDTLSELALNFDIGLHVDACLGGFVLTFCENVPTFDFRLQGVTSISIDTHKYGCAAKGTSVVLFRSNELRHRAYFPFAQWAGGLYVTPTLAGSRPGALIVCAWAAMMSIGVNGYKRRAQSIVQSARLIAEGIQSVPGLKLMTPNPSVVVCFGSDEFNIYTVQDELSRLGWGLNAVQNPAGVNICITHNVVDRTNDFVRDLSMAVKTVCSSPGKQTGTATIYGATQKLPAGPIQHSLCCFVDATLSP